MLNQSASLHLPGLSTISCLITQISKNQLSLILQDQLHSQRLEQGKQVEIHVGNSSNNLKVHATIEKISDSDLLLSYVNPQDASITQLINNLIPATASQSPANEQAIINELSDISIRQLSSLIEIYLEQADSRLLSLAEAATNNDNQNKLFEIKAQLQQHSDAIKQQYCQHLRAGFHPQYSPKADLEQAMAGSMHKEMALIDLDEFEDWLSLKKIIIRGNERHYQPLACLSERYSQLVHQTIEDEELPVSIHNICQALQEVVKEYRFAPELLPLLYRFFDEAVISRLDNLFDTLNSRLKAYGILPNIESQILHKQQTKPATAGPSNGSHTLASSTAVQSDANIIPLHNNPELYSTVSDILSLLRSTANTEQVPDGNAVAPQQLVDALSAIQANQQAINSIAQGQSLQSWLQSNTDIHLSGELQDLLKLVTNIFQSMHNHPQIPSLLMAQIKRLEVPIAKTAIQDSDFFTSPEHPAKLLLNQLIELCLNSDMPSRALEKSFTDVISSITDNAQQGREVFQQALTDVTAIAKHQGNAYNRNIERITQTYEGRQRVHQAQEAVERELRQRVSPPRAPDIIIDLINNGWRELLKLTYIRLGPDSDIWHEHLATLDQLSAWLNEHDSDENRSRSTIERELEADSFVDLIAQHLNNVFPGDYRYQGTVEKIRDTLKGRREAIIVDLENNDAQELRSPNDLQKELKEANPQLKRWFKRAKSLQVGDEFSYLNDDTGQRNIKLAWVSDNQQHFVFVNSRGQKVLDFDLVDLANELSKGMSPVEKTSEWPLVERSLYSTVQQAYEQLAFKSSHDELTGLLSRKECERILGNAVLDAKNNLRQHSLLYIDIDNFSLTNNLHGHVAGDQLLIDISNLLKDKSPEEAIIARMAGNEFVILLQHIEMPEAHNTADKLCQHIEDQKFLWQDHIVQFTTSIGLMTINKYTENVVDLIRNAVSASQTAKQHGGNRVNEFRQDAELHQRREKLLSWIDKLNNVLNSDKLILRGQQITSLNADDKEPHYEILLAIKDDNGKLNSPIEFIEAAECYNRMQRVDRWVIENTFQWLNTLSDNAIKPPAVSINLSGNSLNDDQFVDFILEQFTHCKIPTNNICFEVTETATINNLAEAADFIREVKKMGCKFSLDDFGSGNASYQYLKHLPVDYLKIDGTFVQEMDKNKNDHALVQSINEIAHLMGIKTIAEYAESEEIIQLLSDIGVDYAQGYAISRPTELNKLNLN